MFLKLNLVHGKRVCGEAWVNVDFIESLVPDFSGTKVTMASGEIFKNADSVSQILGRLEEAWAVEKIETRGKI